MDKLLASFQKIKMKIALTFACVSALAVIVAGIASDARFVTLLLRALLGFLVAGVVSYAIAMIAEYKGVADVTKEMATADVSKKKAKKKKKKAAPEEAKDEDAAPGEKDAGESTEEEAENQDFEPLAADDLERVETSQAS